MAEPTTSQILEQLNDKLNTDLSNIASNMAVIKEVIVNDNGTCVLFSNGFKIQWGMYEVAANATTPKLVTFPKRFSNSNYFFKATPIYNAGDLEVRYQTELPNVRSLTSTQVTYTCTKANWIAVGF